MRIRTRIAVPVARPFPAKPHGSNAASRTSPTRTRAPVGNARSKPNAPPAGYRRITRWVGEAALERMQARMAARPEIIQRRGSLVEHPFGSIKFWMEQRAFLMRGLKKVQAEFSLTALAYNLKRVLNILGVERLKEGLKTALARWDGLCSRVRPFPASLSASDPFSWPIAPSALAASYRKLAPDPWPEFSHSL